MNSCCHVLDDLSRLENASSITLLGAGETRQEFARRLRVLRPDIKAECFLDSYREGQWESIAIHRPSHLHNLSPLVQTDYRFGVLERDRCRSGVKLCSGLLGFVQ